MTPTDNVEGRRVGIGPTTAADQLHVMGYEREADTIQELFFAGKRDEAIRTVPSAFADEISLVGPKERIGDRLDAWKESAVTTMIVSGDLDTLRTIAELAA